MRKVILLTALFAFLNSADEVWGKDYAVGPGQAYERIGEVADLLEPGDVVELHGDTREHVVLTRHGKPEKPITIRGATHIEDGKLVRPRILPDGKSDEIVACKGDWNVLEGLDIGWATHGPALSKTCAVSHDCRELTVRNCYIHHSRVGILGEISAGSIRIAHTEFDSNGGGIAMHSVDIWSVESPDASAIIEFCYFHDATLGALLKSHCKRTVVRYNWFEGSYSMMLSLVGPSMAANEQETTLESEIYPLHTDIVGNVFVQGWSPGFKYAIMSVGGEHEMSPGTEGDITIAHNLLVVTRGGESAGVPILVHGNVDHVKAYNNAFVEYGVKGCELYLRGNVWDTPRTRQFVKKRGSGEPVIEGANNWASVKTKNVPGSFKNTIRGTNPRFVDPLNWDYRPRKDSSLAGAGMWPLPKGRIIDLSPEYEPQRGIPSDLKPRPRRKATPPSIGPFEAEQ